MAAGWVLGTLSPEEAERFALHLDGCDLCQAEVAGLREAADAMADVVPPATAPPRLKRRVMSAVRREAELFDAAAAPHPSTSPPSTRRAGTAAVLIAGGVMLLVIGALIGNALRGDNTPSVKVRTIPGTVTRAGGGSDARASVRLSGGDARLVMTTIKPPPDGRIYQAWLERPPATPVSTGALFSIGPTRATTIVLPALGRAERVIVTAEPPGGSRVPTLPTVVAVPLPAR